MRFAALTVCLCLCVAAMTAMAEDVAEGMIGAGLRATADAAGPVGFARLSLDTPLGHGFGLRGRLDVSGPAGGANPEVELGAGLRLGEGDVSAFADLRHATLAEGTVAVTGIDYLARAGTLTLEAGPRLFLGDDGYARATLGPDQGDDGPGGLLTAGLRLTARYELGADWGLEGGVRIDRPLPGADAPGTTARMTASVMATHRFQLEF